MSERPEVQFRRVERLDREKVEWIERLARNYEGLTNVSLAVLRLEHEARKPSQVSVQVIDNNLVYLVAIAEHEGLHTDRDIRIRDEEAARIWISYYDASLWSRAQPIVERGKFDRTLWQRLRSQV
jgi:hypothetical protein